MSRKKKLQRVCYFPVPVLLCGRWLVVAAKKVTYLLESAVELFQLLLGELRQSTQGLEILVRSLGSFQRQERPTFMACTRRPPGKRRQKKKKKEEHVQLLLLVSIKYRRRRHDKDPLLLVFMAAVAIEETEEAEGNFFSLSLSLSFSSPSAAVYK